jgi:hypothetical protein
MNVVVGNHVIKDTKTVTVPNLIQQFFIGIAVTGKLQKECFVMTPVGDMPNVAGSKVSVRSWHKEKISAASVIYNKKNGE